MIRICPLFVYPLSTSSDVTKSLRPSPSIFATAIKNWRWEWPRNEARSSLVLMYLPPPLDPTQWTEDQVYRWAEWTVQEFKLTSVNLSALKGINGHQLCSFTHQQFYQLCFNTRDALYLQQYLDIIKAGKPTFGNEN